MTIMDGVKNDIIRTDESSFINFSPIKALTILAELLAEQEGKKAVNIKIYKKGEKVS